MEWCQFYESFEKLLGNNRFCIGVLETNYVYLLLVFIIIGKCDMDVFKSRAVILLIGKRGLS